jgi:hypothetical protein
MTGQPVTVSEIADLLAQIRAVTYPAPFDPAARAAALARKAELLARIAEHNAAEQHDKRPGANA